MDFSTTGSWLQYACPNSNRYVVVRYSITSANDAPERDPMDWNLQGSNDGANWTTIDSRTGLTFDSHFFRQEFTCSNSIGYKVYRLNITKIANQSTANSVQLSEIELIGHIDQ